MRKIDRNDIDINKWNHLVMSQSQEAIFSLSNYLDVTAKNWCIFVIGDYEGGIAVPFFEKFGVKSIYTPIFIRYMQWFGKGEPEKKDLIYVLSKHFHAGHLAIFYPLNSIKNPWVFQQIKPLDELKFNQQAKRMIKKFDKSDLNLTLSDDPKEVMFHIRNELPQKIKSLNNNSLDNLEKLVLSLMSKNLLNTLIVKQNGTILGGIFLIKSNQTLLYLKGSFNSYAKENGAMYKAIETAIEMARIEKLTFDFGGSRVNNVKRFNHNVGGIDIFYDIIEWNNAPFWYKLLKKGKKILRQH